MATNPIGVAKRAHSGSQGDSHLRMPEPFRPRNVRAIQDPAMRKNMLALGAWSEEVVDRIPVFGDVNVASGELALTSTLAQSAGGIYVFKPPHWNEMTVWVFGDAYWRLDASQTLYSEVMTYDATGTNPWSGQTHQGRYTIEVNPRGAASGYSTAFGTMYQGIYEDVKLDVRARNLLGSANDLVSWSATWMAVRTL